MTKKAWIDQVCRAGRTFYYTQSGPQGMMSGKRAVVVYVSGGTELGSDIDFASAYKRHVLGFIGITEVEIVAADKHIKDEAAISQARSALAALDLTPHWSAA